MAHVSDEKKKVVEDFVHLMEKYPIVGAVNLENLPTRQLQTMRESLRKKVVLKVTKRRLMKFAIKKACGQKKGLEHLEKHLLGMPGLLFTSENPFSLYKTLQKSKSPAPAKAGQIAPNDIIIPAGPTNFAPGPIIGELSSIGVKTGVEGGKVAVKADSVVVFQGETIKPKVAEILGRLGINPMEMGLDLVAVYEHGVIYTKDVLAIDEVKFMSDLRNAARWAVNLGVYSGYPTKDTIKLMIQKSSLDAKALCIARSIMSKDTIGDLLAKATREMLGVKEELHL